MGIHGLFPFLQKHCPQVIHQVTDLSQFKDKTFAIDVAVLMYAASYGYRNNSLRNNANLPDTVTEDTSYLTYFTDHAAKLDRLGIKYIYVFDGAAPESKQQELKRRKQTQDTLSDHVKQQEQVLEQLRTQLSETIANISQTSNVVNVGEASSADVERTDDTTLSFAIDIPLENDDETKDTIAVMPAFKKQRIDEQGQAAVVEPNQQQIAALTEDINKREQEIAKKKSRIHLVDHSHYDVLKTMFDHFNIPYEEAPGEAEKYCVELCLQKRADVVVTNDADALVHGAPILLRYLFSSRFPTSMLYYDEVLQGLGADWDENMFIDFGIMCGCDYTGTIKGVGPAKAFQIINKHKSINKFWTSLESIKYAKFKKDMNYPKARAEFNFTGELNPLKENFGDDDEEVLEVSSEVAVTNDEPQQQQQQQNTAVM